jgi:lysophospholipase L1-like esterase
MRNAIQLIVFLFVFVLTVSFIVPDEKVYVYLIGDSTMSDKETKFYPETGWGMPFRHFFDTTVVVENHAKNGRSTRTFLSENRWAAVYEKLKKGDYVFIQFGHNDEVKEKVDRYATPDEYKANLLRFVSDARAKGATPVLLTPVARRKFDNGSVLESHAAYSALVRVVAKDNNVAFIDLDDRSKQLLQSFGEEPSKLLFLHLEAGEHPNYPEGKADNTHFNELGARKVAQIVLQEIIALQLGLADHIVKPLKKS